MRSECLSGKLLCGQCKKILGEKIKLFISEHQERRAKITKELIDKRIIKK
jgi:tryptophanyl-tRNA synthetase